MSPALACPRPSAADIDARSPEGWNRRAAASVLQASGLRSDVTVFRLNTAAGCQSCSETALRRNTTERVYRVEAAHNPEVAGSNPAPATSKGPGNGAFRLLVVSLPLLTVTGAFLFRSLPLCSFRRAVIADLGATASSSH